MKLFDIMKGPKLNVKRTTSHIEELARFAAVLHNGNFLCEEFLPPWVRSVTPPQTNRKDATATRG